MGTFKIFLTEDQNKHIEHLEDLIFNNGVNGARQSILFLRSLRDMLAGHSPVKLNTSVKYDGSPSIIAGIDPEDNRFFVAKKSIFNANPKVYKTEEEIDQDTSGDLANKLKKVFKALSKINLVSGVYQGDLMFTSDSLKREKINNEDYITFHPNTIVYAVPYNSIEGRKIRTSEIGIAWHTAYEGNTLKTLKVVPSKNIANKFQSSTSWMVDVEFRDYSGQATFTSKETSEITNLLSQAGKLFNTINGRAIDDISRNTDFLALIKSFNNSYIKQGKQIEDFQAYVSMLFHYIYDKLQKDIDSKKTDKGKQGAIQKRTEILKWFSIYSRDDMVKIYKLASLIQQAKHLIINKMNQINLLATFIKTTNGFKTTSHEGFVCIDHLTNNTVKLVNRMEFSRANFSPDILHGWSK